VGTTTLQLLHHDGQMMRGGRKDVEHMGGIVSIQSKKGLRKKRTIGVNRKGPRKEGNIAKKEKEAVGKKICIFKNRGRKKI